MKNSFAFSTRASALAALSLLITVPAHAGLGACGDIDVEANATCDVRVKGCDVNCTPLTIDAACSVQLEASCRASCPELPSVECSASCQGSCEADCNVKPAEFDCAATCRADATAQCDAECASNSNQQRCAASCRATFAARCDASCKVTPGSATCKAKCQGRCEGSCSASSNLQCQVDCQGKLYAACEARVQGGCTADCSQGEGALFCEGEYIDHNGTVKECLAAIEDALPTVTVEGSLRGDSSCTGSSCMANGQAEASASCAYAPAAMGAAASVWGGLPILGLLGAACMRRRRAR